jgi:hypothetical protein
MQRANNEQTGGVTGRGFMRGQSGNPRGRPKGAVSLNAVLRRTLTRDNAKAICARLIALAEGGDLTAIKLLFERLDFDLETRLEALEKHLLKKEPANDETKS